MKFSEMKYTRPDIDALRAALAGVEERIRTARSDGEQIEAFYEEEKLLSAYATQRELASIRNTIDTRDPFYEAERAFFDERSPEVEEADHKVTLALLASPFRAELEERLGSLLFRNAEIAVRAFSPEIMDSLARENKLMSEYQTLYGQAAVEWEGKTVPLPMLGPYKESTDPAVRRAAYEKEGAFFDSKRKELDELYGELVRLRNEMGRKLGHKNFIQLGYDRLGRNCYGYGELKAFRVRILRDVVPVTEKLRRAQAKRIGVERLTLCDSPLLFAEGNPKPHGSAREILAAGREMYHALSPETAEFIDFLYDGELLDVLSKDGKAPGGYCTEIADYQAPFIFSNFNGTSGDVDVLTHEAGHAFAAYRAFRRGYPRALLSPTIEACEVHSMSMEFLTSPEHHRFFGGDTARYGYAHAADALLFLPYGCEVDEFQHRMYEEEDLTPEGRNAVWRELEEKYRPSLSAEGLPFYGRGAGWQRQLHIYLDPLYYIDYCMAQTVAFQFWCEMLADRETAWKKYLAFVDLGGTRTFEELVRGAGLRVPYEEGCLADTAARIDAWLEQNAPAR